MGTFKKAAVLISEATRATGSSTRRCALLLLAVLIAPGLLSAQTYHVLYNFTGRTDGSHPGRMVMDAGGNLYGSTLFGGNGGSGCVFGGVIGCGAIFEMRHTVHGWIFTPLYTFKGGADGARPGPLVFGPDGALYGTTMAGGTSCHELPQGCGTIFKLTPPPSFCRTALCTWTKTTLYNFAGGDDGWNYGWDGLGPVTFAADGSMYGATWYGGHNGNGTVFKLARVNGQWTESVIHTFHEADGISPSDGVILDQAGNVYGVTHGGGPNYAGIVYELSPSQNGWTQTILYAFNQAQDYEPTGGLIFDQAGNLYGTTTSSINDKGGVVFKLSPSQGYWTYQVLHEFANGLSGGGPQASLMMDASGDLYGTAVESPTPGGAVFRLAPNGGDWLETDLYDFTARQDGGYPISNVLMDAGGNLYGSASSYGGNDAGVLWEITPQ